MGSFYNRVRREAGMRDSVCNQIRFDEIFWVDFKVFVFKLTVQTLCLCQTNIFLVLFTKPPSWNKPHCNPITFASPVFLLLMCFYVPCMYCYHGDCFMFILFLMLVVNIVIQCHSWDCLWVVINFPINTSFMFIFGSHLFFLFFSCLSFKTFLFPFRHHTVKWKLIAKWFSKMSSIKILFINTDIWHHQKWPDKMLHLLWWKGTDPTSFSGHSCKSRHEMRICRNFRKCVLKCLEVVPRIDPASEKLPIKALGIGPVQRSSDWGNKLKALSWCDATISLTLPEIISSSNDTNNHWCTQAI